MGGVYGIFGAYKYFNYGSSSLKRESEKAINKYLANEGVSKESLKSNSTSYNKKDGMFSLSVVYKDEPNKVYVYIYSNVTKKVLLDSIFKSKNGKLEYEYPKKGKHADT